MRKQTICIGENKCADQLRGSREADQRLCFRYTIEQSLYFLNTKFMFLAVLCYCAVQFVSDLVGNHNVGFPTRWLICKLVLLQIVKHIMRFYQEL